MAGKEQKYGVGIIGVAVISGVMAWWFTKDIDKKVEPVAPSIETVEDPEKPSEGISDYVVDGLLKTFGTDRVKIGKALALINRMVEAAEMKSEPPSEPDPADKPATELHGYPAAYARAKASNQPLLILVGAKWCQFCQGTKDVIESMILAGTLRATFAYIDEDAEPGLAAQLKEGADIPQLIYYPAIGAGGRRRIGAATQADIRALMEPLPEREYQDMAPTGMFRRRR